MKKSKKGQCIVKIVPKIAESRKKTSENATVTFGTITKKMKLPAQPVASTSTTKPQSTGRTLCGVVEINN